MNQIRYILVIISILSFILFSHSMSLDEQRINKKELIQKNIIELQDEAVNSNANRVVKLKFAHYNEFDK